MANPDLQRLTDRDLCSKLPSSMRETGTDKSKMASVEEIRTRISLREHDVINVSWTSFYALKIEYIILQTVPDSCFFLQTHSTDFPGNYTGYDDTWSQEHFEQVSELAPEIYSANSVVEA